MEASARVPTPATTVSPSMPPQGEPEVVTTMGTERPSSHSSHSSLTSIESPAASYSPTKIYGNVYFEPWQGSDAILIVEDTKLHVHSQILSLASPVFAKMFSSSFKEGVTKVVNLPGKSVMGVISLLNLVYPTEYKITGKMIETTNCQELLQLAKEYEIRRIFNLIDDYMAMFSTKDVQSLKLAEDYDLQRTKDAAIRTLIQVKDKRIFNSSKYKSLKSSSKLKILQGKVKFALTACDELCTLSAQQNCQHGYIIHPPFSFKGHTDTICCRKEGPLEVLNRLKANELAMLKVLLE